MSERDISLDGLVMYRRLAQEALEAAQKTRDRALRADYLEIAEHWKSVAKDIEKLLIAQQDIGTRGVKARLPPGSTSKQTALLTAGG
jgi:hypothetical protein